MPPDASIHMQAKSAQLWCVLILRCLKLPMVCTGAERWSLHLQAGHSRLACAQVHEEFFRSTLGAAAAEFASRAARVRYLHSRRQAALFLCTGCTMQTTSGTRLSGLSEAAVV